MVVNRFCKHGNLRLTCDQCKADSVLDAEARVQEHRRRGESGTVGRIEGAELPYPWQNEGVQAWRDGGRNGLVALSLGLPFGDMPYAAIADVVNDAPTTNVLIACAPTETESLRATLSERFGLAPSSLADHHFLEPKDDGVLVVADVEELQTVDLATWGRFATDGLLVLMDADGVGPHLGQLLLDAPFRHRFSLSRKPSSVDLLLSRPWARAFGPLLYRFKEEQARDLGVLPRIRYRLHVEMLRPEGGEETGPTGPWEPTDIPTRLPGFTPGSFVKGRARDVAIRRCTDQEGLVVLHDGVPVPGAAATMRPSELPDRHDEAPQGWLLALPTADARTLMRVATTAWKTLQAPGLVEDAVVLPVPADLCTVPPWDDRWRSAAAQIDRVVTGLLLAEEPGDAMSVEDLEALVGVALALRGLPAEDLYGLTPVVAEAARAAHEGTGVAPDRVRDVARAFGGVAAALFVGAAAGPMHLLRIAHPRFTPVTPDLPHPSLFDARQHAWRGKAFAALGHAAQKEDLVTAWGRYPELRFVFPSSSLLEAATWYCAAHKLRGPLHEATLQAVADRTRIADGDREAAAEVLQVWRRALGTAEEHEREFLADMHARQPERERRREGMALPGLAVADVKPDQVALESTMGRFPATNIAPGSEVSIVEQGERKEVARGLVTRISSRRIAIEFPSGAPRHLPKRVTVNLVFDAKVFEAYHSAVLGALRAMQASSPDDDGPDGLLRACLLGETGEGTPQSLDVPELTPSQRGAIDSVLSGGRVRLVHGPPGTGKTHTLVFLSMALTRAGHSVLVTADSNAAVDNLVVGLRRQGALVVRIGHAPNLRDEAAEPARIDPLEAPLFVRWAAGQGIVVATTNYGAFRYLDAKGSVSPYLFDYVVHDEAGQATAPSSLAAVMRGRRLVLAGDPLQLPPTVVSMDAKEAGLDVTLFERIEELTGHDRTRLLATQFRMREPILAFSNERYYEGRIETAPSAADQEGLPEVPPLAFQHVTGRENDRQRNGSISNDFEVEAVTHLVQKFRGEARDRGWTMAVLTPYQAQRERLRRQLPDVEVSTVDGAQGREWDLVFYSSVRSNPRHRLGFVEDERRLNVAVTRARRNFVLVGDERTLRDHEGLSRLLDKAEKIRMFYPDRDRPSPGRRGRRKRGRSDRKGSPPPAASPPSDGPGEGKKGRRRRRRRRGRGPRDDGKEGDEAGGSDTTGGEDTPARRRQRPRRGEPGPGSPDEDPKGHADAGPRRGKKRRETAKAGTAGPDAQCVATTKVGTRCKLKARPGSDRCARHQ